MVCRIELGFRAWGFPSTRTKNTNGSTIFGPRGDDVRHRIHRPIREGALGWNEKGVGSRLRQRVCGLDGAPRKRLPTSSRRLPHIKSTSGGRAFGSCSEIITPQFLLQPSDEKSIPCD